MKKIEIKTPSRLHFGIINIKNPDFNLYGCVGCAIENPNFLIIAKESDKLILDVKRKDVKYKIQKLISALKMKIKAEIKTISTIPEHEGFGSTTQLTLAISYALCFFNNIKFDAYKIAEITGLGKISGIGIGAFLYGGFLIDSGKVKNEIPKIVFRCDFPKEWIFAILIPKNSDRGLKGKEEMKAFKELNPTPKERIEEMLILLGEMKNSLKNKDIEMFGKALSKFQINVGLNFFQFQKGIFSSKVHEKLIEILKSIGAYGVGQSSWGPAVYGLFLEEEEQKILKEISKYTNINLIITKANNYGVKIK
jgi:beta-ribofuranosylaminobenzene 5'-phosphate synthase